NCLAYGDNGKCFIYPAHFKLIPPSQSPTHAGNPSTNSHHPFLSIDEVRPGEAKSRVVFEYNICPFKFTEQCRSIGITYYLKRKVDIAFFLCRSHQMYLRSKCQKILCEYS